MPRDGTGQDDGASSLNNTRRRFLKSAGAAGAIGVSATAGCAGGIGGSSPTTINIFAWDDYKKQQELIEDKLDVNIKATVTSSSAKMFSAFKAGQSKQYDITVPNNNYVVKFANADTVVPVNKDVVTNYKDLFGKFKEFANRQFTVDGKLYGVPIRFGWYGYSYDSRKLPPSHEQSYKALFSETYEGVDMKGNVVMYDNHFKAMAATALLLGYQDAFKGKRVTLSKKQIEKVKQKLLDQKPLIQGYIAPDSTYIKSFRQGNHVVGQSGRNEIMDMRRAGDNWARMAKPKEGELAWFEGAVVSKDSDNQEMAWKVINEYISPEVGAEFAKAASTPSCNPESNKNLSSKLQKLFGFGPERLNGMIPFKAVENEDAWISAWEEVKSA
ncbi:MAG: PotD/PotF family extracellular solute-binding protein [Halobacteriales archaeon]